MSLYNDPPHKVTFEGRAYRLKAPFDTVLFCYSLLDRSDILPLDKIRLCVRLLVGRVWMKPQKQERLLREIFRVLSDGEEEADAQKVMDFEQDAAYIRAAFWQEYGIDLDKARGRLSWFRFIDLLSGLTDATAFIRIVQIRSRPVPPMTKHNREEVRQLIEQKARFALKDKNADARYQGQLAALFNSLAQKAKAGD